MIELPYQKETVAGTVTDAIIAAGMPQYPTADARFYGVSVFDGLQKTIVYVVDDITPDEVTTIDGIIAAQP